MFENYRKQRTFRQICLSILAILLLNFAVGPVSPLTNSPKIVQAADESAIKTLQQTIADRNAQIVKLNQEIQALNGQIVTTAKEAQSLKGVITTLDTTKNKLTKELDVTQKKVGATTLTIEQLGIEIEDKEKRIKLSKEALADAIRSMNQAESSSLIETVLTYKNMSDLWGEIDNLGRFQVGVQKNMSEVEILKGELSEKLSQHEGQKKTLLELKGELEDRKKIVEINKNEKAQLLSSTQSKEAEYRKQLAEKKRLSDAFAAEILQYESQLKILIDPTSYPKAGKGILSWPLKDVLVTQYFGNTAFAKSGAYSGNGHNGVDFRASPGTAVIAADSGVVAGVGNTDAVPGCYSYGKWVMIKHNNGLSTLYAHLSLIKATQGQQVNRGEIIGYSGNTGYSTGPHLHFGVYATQGVKIVKYENSINCKNAVIPLADLKAYLNPMEYL